MAKSKDATWRWFSKYIRARDCLATTGELEYGICVTCGEKYSFKDLQAGHAMAGRNLSILFDEELVNAQCYKCNGYGGGKYAEYSLWFIDKYGRDKWEEKIRVKNQIKVKLDYDELWHKYRDAYNKLLKGA